MKNEKKSIINVCVKCYGTNLSNSNISLQESTKISYYGIGGSVPLGMDYDLTDYLYIGIEVRLFNYIQSRLDYAPAEWLGTQSENIDISFLSYPSLRFGFKF